MIDTTHALARELRRMRIPVAASDLVTAAESLTVTDLSDRDAVREALAANLAKSREHRGSFDLLFDLYFASSPSASSLDDVDDEQLRDALARALALDDRHLLERIAATAVERYARIEPGRRVGGALYALRTLRGLGVASPGHAEGNDARDPSAGALRYALAARRERDTATMFEQIVESEIRRRLVADRGADAVAATLRHPLPEDADFVTASTQTIAQMSQVLAPLGQRLSRTLAARRRSAPRRRLDVRRTLRASLSTGGTPVRIHLLPPRPPKPRLVLIADISGSVASFAAFALQLTYALRAGFSRLRTFVFTDGIDEVTDLIEQTSSIADTTARINREGRGVGVDGRSDYGAALNAFAERHSSALDSNTIVLLLGDARTNHRDPRAGALQAIRAKAGALYWLNPEARALWDDGDAVIGAYAEHCDAVVECRTIRQLKNFVAELG